MTGRLGSPAPLLKDGETVVLFDGTCKLCNGWAKFIIRHDRLHRIRLATVQSTQGQQLLAWAGLPTDHFNTIVLIVNDRFFVRSDVSVRPTHLPNSRIKDDGVRLFLSGRDNSYRRESHAPT
jgi:predicted DCC family thiol-disulfide oxidoreductase YuxK